MYVVRLCVCVLGKPKRNSVICLFKTQNKLSVVQPRARGQSFLHLPDFIVLQALSSQQEDVVGFLILFPALLNTSTLTNTRHSCGKERVQSGLGYIPLCNTRQGIQYLQHSLSKQRLGTGGAEGWKIPSLLSCWCDPLFYYNDSINANRP